MYSSTTRSCLEKVDFVYNERVRDATGAFRTSLYCEAGMISLDLRRQLLLLIYVAKILTVPSHTNHVLLANNRLVRIYDRRSTFTRRAGICPLEHTGADSLSLSSVRSAPSPKLLRKPNCRLDVTNRYKILCHHTELKLFF